LFQVEANECLASLQIPYLLNVALSVTSYLPAFPPSPTATFKLLRKLDHAFAGLLKGEDSETGESLPGFEAGKRAGMSRTDMVRCKSLVESTRVLIVDVMSQDPEVERDEPEESGTETDAMSIDESGYGIEDEHDMDVARVYEGTIVQLGELLGNGFDAGSGQS
jgi:Subunit 11 of the general transcription factor TFIIH